MLDRDGGSLSVGEQQLLALARCLVGDPDFLLLNELTEGVQPSIIEEIETTLLGLRGNRGLSILLVEQNFDVISVLSDRVLVLERGRITGELGRSDLSDRAKVDRLLGFGTVRFSRTHAEQRQRAQPANRPQFTSRTASSAEPAARDVVSDMTVRRPTLSQMREMANWFGMNLTDGELREYSEIMAPYIQAYDRLDTTPDNLPSVHYPERRGRSKILGNADSWPEVRRAARRRWWRPERSIWPLPGTRVVRFIFLRRTARCTA